MGDTLNQVVTFKNQITKLLEPPQFDHLSEQLIKIVNKDKLKSLLEYVLTIPNEKLQNYNLANGDMFLREDTHQVFSFYIGRDYDGTYGLALTQKGKSPDGLEGSAKVKKEGVYKRGKIAEGIDLISVVPIKIFGLTLKEAGELEIEMSFCRAVNSPFVARYLSTNKYQHAGKEVKQALFMKYAKQGNLWDFVRSNKMFYVSEFDEWKMIYTLLAGVRHIHNSVHPDQKNMRHRDLKTANLLRLDNGAVQIIDFGCWDSGEMGGRTPFYCGPEYLERDYCIEPTTVKESAYYQAPCQRFWSKATDAERETWPMRISGLTSDVWGTAICCYEILMHGIVYTSQFDTLYAAQLDTNHQYYYEYLQKMLAANPAKRCNMEEAVSLFLKNLENKTSADQQKTWIQDMITLYTQDFHRIQFLSELHQSGCKEFLKYIPPEKNQLMKIEELMKLDTFLTISEWFRIRDLYKSRCTGDEMHLFDTLLYNRPEFQPHLVGASLWYAMRINDRHAIEIIRQKKCDVSNLFKNYIKLGRYLNHTEFLENGLCAWFFPGDYSDAQAKWMLSHNANINLLKDCIEKPENKHLLNLLIKAMLKYKDLTWQVVVSDYVKEHLITVEIFNKLVKAGIDREALAKFVLLQLTPDDFIIKSMFDRNIIQWCIYGKHPIYLDETVIYKVARTAIAQKNRVLFVRLNVDIEKLLSFILSDNTEFSANIKELQILREFNISIDEALSKYIQAQSKEKQSAVYKVNCYIYWINILQSCFSETQWRLESQKISIMQRIIDPELSEDKLEPEPEPETEPGSWYEKYNIFYYFQLTRARAKTTREDIVHKIIDITTVDAANKLISENPQWFEVSRVGDKRKIPMGYQKNN